MNSSATLRIIGATALTQARLVAHRVAKDVPSHADVSWSHDDERSSHFLRSETLPFGQCAHHAYGVEARQHAE